MLGLRAVEQAFVEGEGLEADDGEVEREAEGVDVLGGGEDVAGVRGVGEVGEIVEEELDARVAVESGLVEFVGEVVDAWPTQGHGGDAETVGHCGVYLSDDEAIDVDTRICKALGCVMRCAIRQRCKVQQRKKKGECDIRTPLIKMKGR